MARSLPILAAVILTLLAPLRAESPAETPPLQPDPASRTAAQTTGAKKSPSPDTPPASTSPAAGLNGDQGGSSKSANSPGETSVRALAPAPPPPGPIGRPRIGLALAGGAALAMSEIGVLQWFEEHHIPVDMIAGTSMGSLVGALYATGDSVDQLKQVMNNEVFNQVFRIDTSYKDRNFRRREEGRALPNEIQIGLRHGVSFRNSVLTDQGLNAFLDREFYRYDDRVEFNSLPIPYRCLATDLNDARPVTFARGSIADAVRASVSIPGIYRPFEMNGHEYVDGGVLENLPTQTVRDMHADVILAVNIPLAPVAKGELDSIVGVLERSFSVAISANERESRTLANVVISPDLTGFNGGDYLKTKELSARGYAAAEQNKTALLKYAVTDAQWAEYISARTARVRGPAGNILRVRVKAPTPSATAAVEKAFHPLLNQPMNTHTVEQLLNDIRSDGRYDADYTVAYENPPGAPEANRPSILVTVTDKKTGPPFLEFGTNVEAETGATPRISVEGILLDQDLGGYGSELRTTVKAGWLTEAGTEYYRRLPAFNGRHPGDTPGGLFLAPRVDLLRQPYNIYQNQVALSERLLQRAGGGIDFGWSNQTTQELRAGWEMNDIRWQPEVGSGNDNLPNVSGSMQRARIRYVFDNQDRALVPQFGMHLVVDAGYLFHAATSPGTTSEAPQITTQASFAHDFAGKNIAFFALEGGTMFHRNVAEPFRFTLGGPLRLTASAFDEYRGTDYFLFDPAYLRRIASLPAPLGQSIYVGAGYEAGQMRAPGLPTVTRQDVYFGIVAETPLGVITLAPALGDDGHRKLVFTLGKLF